jgi:carbamoylphosphate synthase large subunit
MKPIKRQVVKSKLPVKKKITRFRIRVRSRHPSHDPLREQLPLLPFRGIVSLGSTTVKDGDAGMVRCNTPEAVQNSANKLRMKQCFSNGNVRSAKWLPVPQGEVLPNLEFPVVAKSHMGSRGRGNTLLKTVEEYSKWVVGKTVGNYILEEFHDYNREYRLHVTEEGCFYTCRKMLRSETPEKDRWFRNDSNSTWIMENNPTFDKPTNWSDIVSECVKALKSVGLDVGACDVKVQSSKDKKGNVRKAPEFIVIEINSAPSFGEVTLQKYLEQIPRILTAKFHKKV